MAELVYHLQVYPSASSFLDRVRPLLEADEARNGLMLGLALHVETEPHAYGDHDPYFATVTERDTETGGDAIVVAVLMTPPHGVIFYSTRQADDEGVAVALEAVAHNLRNDGWAVPTVNGSVAIATHFAQIWSALTGNGYDIEMTTRVFALQEVIHPRYSPGHLRVATSADHDLVAAWYRAFEEEAVPSEAGSEERRQKVIRQKIGDGHLYFWEDQLPVSMVGLTRPTAHGIAIGPVYTPPEERGRGYASSAVARLSQAMLDQGKEFCALFTDLANPTSNHIYQAIGYRALGDNQVYRFTA